MCSRYVGTRVNYTGGKLDGEDILHRHPTFLTRYVLLGYTSCGQCVKLFIIISYNFRVLVLTIRCRIVC